MRCKLSIASLLLCAILLSACNPQDTLPHNSAPVVTSDSSKPTIAPAITAVQGYLKKRLEAEVNTLLRDNTLSRENREVRVQVFEEIASWLNGSWSGQYLSNSKWRVTTIHSFKGSDETKSWLFDEESRRIQETD